MNSHTSWTAYIPLFYFMKNVWWMLLDQTWLKKHHLTCLTSMWYHWFLTFVTEFILFWSLKSYVFINKLLSQFYPGFNLYLLSYFVISCDAICLKQFVTHLKFIKCFHWIQQLSYQIKSDNKHLEQSSIT